MFPEPAFCQGRKETKRTNNQGLFATRSHWLPFCLDEELQQASDEPSSGFLLLTIQINVAFSFQALSVASTGCGLSFYLSSGTVVVMFKNFPVYSVGLKRKIIFIFSIAKLILKSFKIYRELLIGHKGCSKLTVLSWFRLFLFIQCKSTGCKKTLDYCYYTHRKSLRHSSKYICLKQVCRLETVCGNNLITFWFITFRFFYSLWNKWKTSQNTELSLNNKPNPL